MSDDLAYMLQYVKMLGRNVRLRDKLLTCDVLEKLTKVCSSLCCVYILLCQCLCVCVRVCVYMCLCVCMCVCACMRACMCVCAHLYMGVCMYIFVFTHWWLCAQLNHLNTFFSFVTATGNIKKIV